MIQQPKVSVIMPVYNTEQYVKAAIESILNQMLADLELIVIDDGSTDNSVAVINAISDARKQLVVQQNSGQGAARNLGMKYARGKYIYFMDSDDLLVETALETCYGACESSELDFVFFDATNFGSDEHEMPDYERKYFLESGIKSGTQWFQEQLSKGCYRVPVWLNFIRFSFIQKARLSFEKMPHEDDVFTTLLYCRADQVAFIPATFFLRRIRENSTMNSSYTVASFENYLKAAAILLKAAQEMKTASAQLVLQFVQQMVDAATWRGSSLPLDQKIILFGKLIPDWVRYVKFRSLLKLFISRK